MSLYSIHEVTNRSSGEVECQWSDTDILNLHLETLGLALREAGVRIRHLFLPTVYGRSIAGRNQSIQHLFGRLTSLSFDLHDPSEMLENYDGNPPSFRTLIHCARHTLEKLEFSNLFAWSLAQPRRGEHLLEKLWGYEPGRGTEALVFPKLKHLNLSSLVLYTPSLISFLQAQPALEKVLFNHIYLPTRGYGWSDVASALPPGCHSLHLYRCGGLSTPRSRADPPPDSNIEVCNIEKFSPYKHPFPESCGWRASKSYLEREVTKYCIEPYASQRIRIAESIAAAQDSLVRTDPYTGTPLGELLKESMDLERRIASLMQGLRETIKNQDHADYERI